MGKEAISCRCPHLLGVCYEHLGWFMWDISQTTQTFLVSVLSCGTLTFLKIGFILTSTKFQTSIIFKAPKTGDTMQQKCILCENQ